jgi:molecular chaperone HtpG
VTTENFQVDLRGIVEILSHHLYSSPRVFVRELIQNARDALVARERLGQPTASGFQAPIELIVDEPRRALLVRDAGVGLTEQEARQLLSTIGASSKRGEFAQARRDYLGQFGIGLLSCFLVGDAIEVRSRSARDPNAPTMQWVGYGDGTYTVRPADEPLAEPGSEVRVHARPDEWEWTAPGRVRVLAERFARHLDVPIVFFESPTATSELVSLRRLPHELDGAGASEWCEREFGFTPLVMFRLEGVTHGVNGVAYVAPSASGSSKRGGDIVYSHGMFVDDANKQLVPDWATFVRVALDSGDLALTASREAFQESTALETVRDEIGRQIRAQLEALSENAPELFAAFMEAHSASLLSMAAADPDMLDFVARHYLWETSAGSLVFTRLPGHVAYAATVGEFNTYAPLVAAQGGILVNGGYVDGTKVLRAYDKAQSRVSLSPFNLERVLDDLPAPAEADRELAERIRVATERVLDLEAIAVEVRSFRPDSLMVLHVPGKLDAFTFDDAVDDPWADLLSTTAKPKPDRRAKLVLNLRAPAVRALDGGLAPDTRDEAVRALHLMSLLQGGLRLEPEQQHTLAGALQSILLAASASPAQQAHATTPENPTHEES